MKLRKMLYGLSFLLSAFALNSCINEDSVCLPESNEAKVVFSLVLPDNAQTRAEEWSTDYTNTVGDENDNFIDLNGIQVLVFNLHDDTEKSDLYQGTINDFMYTKTGDNVYTYYGTAPAELSARGTYKFVVLANCSKVTDELTINESKITALDNLDYTLADMQYIPMWGVHKAKLELKAGQQYNIGNIDLLRAVSKVSVILSNTVLTTGYKLKGLTVNIHNKSGLVLPTGASGADDTAALSQEGCINIPDEVETAELEVSGIENGVPSVSFYLPEYANKEAKVHATMSVVLGKEGAEDLVFPAGIEFKSYNKVGIAVDESEYNIVRNHIYQFTITQVTGDLYIRPVVQPWTNGTELTYNINVSTSMRLFDSWLYRYDTDKTYTDWKKNWVGSHMVVAPGLDPNSTPVNKPLYSPQIQLMTNIPESTEAAEYGTMQLRLDNTNFQFVQAKKTGGVITEYATGDVINIGQGLDVYTYFYVVPKDGVSWTNNNKVAKVTLIYDDPHTGEMRIPFNYSALPGNSEDSSEIWVYYFPADEYNNADKDKLKMYYQDERNPLVPTEDQN